MANGGGGVWDGNWARLILEIIHEHYKKALDVLPLDHCEKPLLHSGLCIGFADPVTNIIANTLRNADPRKRKRRPPTRDEVLSKIVAGDGTSPPEARTVAERSYYGLRAFLISYFRYLPAWDALRYLYLSRADLLVAVLLIHNHRCCRRPLRIRSHALTSALKSAAYSSAQPNLVMDSFALLPRLHKIHRCRLSAQDIRCLSRLVHKPLKLKKKSDKAAMDLAARRFHQLDMDASIAKVPAGRLTESLRGILLDRIHSRYLKVVPRLPMIDLRVRHHRSLLKAGFCYGPFNSITNIIVNTIWYDTMFPPSESFEVDMICTLQHVESRSLNGLIAFLHASIPDISDHDAMIYLIKSDLNICKVIEMATQEGYTTSVCDDSGYKAAVDASYHPKPEEYLEFVMQVLPQVRSVVRSLLKDPLSSSSVRRLSTLLSHSSLNSFKPAVVLSKDAMKIFSDCKQDFLTQQSFVCRKVKAALQNYEQTTGYCYELCIICGVNDYVGKKRSPGDSRRQFSHANFWASPDNGTSTTLFFAEFSNVEDSEHHQPFCYPVPEVSTQIRCCYCEYLGIRIVHPTEDSWEGAGDYEKIASSEHKLTNQAIISSGKLKDNIMGNFADDYLYLDRAWDIKLIQDMNYAAWLRNLDGNELMRRINPMRP
ncbi:uncharacterized protein LOC102707021 [Oryza brachyantha]|uniref:Uncharacterized protein n=1 Tax=Oryza brachyantha TaxID=4533 RepID=J3LV53_ORYBR|nr:uncharacterized protein LOC102707021 [Oryza brachyantha]